MTKRELEALKKAAKERKQKADDMDIMVSAIMGLPYGQVKKLMTSEVMAVLEKYGYTN